MTLSPAASFYALIRARWAIAILAPAIIPGLLVATLTRGYADDRAFTPLIDPHRHATLIYPPAELLRHMGGTAHISCKIAPAGYATACETTASEADFGLAVEQMAFNSHFLPAYADSKPVEGRWENTFTFKTKPDLSIPSLDRSHNGRLRLPEVANAEGMSGNVVVTCQIDTVGIAHDCSTTGGTPLLQRLSLAYYSLARYIPAQKNGQAIDAPYTGHVSWNPSHPTDQDGFK